jgi:hypothetical protein
VITEPLSYQHFKAGPNVRGTIPGPGIAVLVAFSAILVLAFARLEGATTINANSASQSDVAAAIASAANGDTVIVPAGTATWTQTLPVKKAITIQGAGIGVTIIKDGVKNTQLLYINLVAGKLTRLTGIEFQDGGRVNTASAPGGLIHVDGNNTDGSSFRMDHCKWHESLNGYAVFDTVIGVVDHNEIVFGTRTLQWVYIYGSRWNGGSYGDGSWSSPVNWGSGEFLFFEDNNLTCLSTQISGGITDGFNGARFVWRHNTTNAGTVGNHGTESPGRGRSCRAMEVYQNTQRCNANRFAAGSRGGTELFWGNTITSCGGAAALSTLASYRMYGSFNPWGGAYGTNGWDENTGPFFTGTVSGCTTGSVSVSGVSWTTNQWQGYTAKRDAGGFNYIEGNNGNTLFVRADIFGNYAHWAAGNGFKIYKIDQSLDQPGAGQNTPFSDDNPTPRLGFTQGVDPCYMWGNTNDGQPFNNFSPQSLNIKQGVHYFNNTQKPGYTPYTYPHPLVSGNPPPSRTSSSPVATRSFQRKPWGGKQKETKPVRRKPWGKDKEKPINELEGQENRSD